jgi:zinc transporter, ZIP family
MAPETFSTECGRFDVSILTTAASLVAFPVFAGIIGGVVAVVRTPPAALVGGVQHFAAGVVMAAVAGEVLPDLRARGPLWLIVVGFSAGVAVLVLLRQSESEEESADGALPVGFLAVVAVDLFIDGLLVATGATVSRRTAIIIAIALTVEVLFLGLAVAVRLSGSGVPRIRAAVVTGGMSLVTAVGAVLGALVLADAGNTALTLVLAFAAAALLWLVVEELLVEAHETPERPWMAVMFFAGFLLLYCLGVLG